MVPQPSGGQNPRINAFRAYFQLNGIEVGTAAGVKAFNLNFGDEDEPLSIINYQLSIGEADAWYDMQGRKLDGKPATKGIYVNGGKKVVVK